MSVLPPAEKLPLAARKSVRDEWDNKREDMEKKLSDLMGVPWTFDFNPNAIYPYAEDNSYMKNNPGACLYAYAEGVPWRLEYFVNSKYDESFKEEVNTICHAHVVTMAVDESKKVKYCDCDVVDGKLRILFSFTGLGTNINDALEQLPDRLNAAPQLAGADGKVPVMGPLTRLSITKEYNEQVEKELEKLKKWFSPEFKLNPMFEENYAFMKKTPAKNIGRDDWESRLGYITFSYFEGVTYHMDYKNFKEDDMLQEGFNDVIDKHEIAFRIVEKLNKGSGYNECIVENGILYLQTTPQNFGTNVGQAIEGVMDLL